MTPAGQSPLAREPEARADHRLEADDGAAAEGAAPPLHDALATDLGTRLGHDLPPALWQRALTGPALEFTRRPSKALRARLCELAWALGGGPGALPETLALVIEALHAGSLIVDDIQDDAHERRGAPALHLLVGVPTAINTGTWLYFWALEQLAAVPAPPAVALAMHREAIRALAACHQGQALDLSARADELDHARIGPVVAAITRGKTACLMGLACRLAAMAAGADEARVAAITELGGALGTGLQMLDDLGGLGLGRRDKGREDLRAARATWPWAWLADVADDLSWSRLQHRLRSARAHGDDAALDGIAGALGAAVEDHGRDQAGQVLRAGFERARVALGDGPALCALAAEMRRLEMSYG